MQFLPRDEKFFDLLFEHATVVFDASSLLANGVGGANGPPDLAATALKVRDLEHKGDETLRKIYRRLHKSFITPIDPEDIHLLATLIDEILDHLDAVAYRFATFGLEQSNERVSEIARLVHGCVESTLAAIGVLQREGVQKPDELTHCCEEINQRELETEDRVREALSELFATEDNAIELIKQKEIFELLESTADCCEHVADVLEGIAVKNS